MGFYVSGENEKEAEKKAKKYMKRSRYKIKSINPTNQDNSYYVETCEK